MSQGVLDMDMKDYADALDTASKETTEAAKALASSLSDTEIEAIKRCAAKAGSVKALFADPEFRKIIERRNGK